MAKHLPCKREDLSSVPRTLIKNLGVVACACSPTVGNAETVPELSQARLMDKLQAN